jgi:outer membrane protein, heavy metal efflux system
MYPSLPRTTIHHPGRSVRSGANRTCRLAALLLLGAKCGSISTTAGHTQVDQIVRERVGQPTRWDQGSPEDRQIAAWLEELLRGGLTRERAVAIALFANPGLQDAYEQLGVSQADMVQAGLPRNPSIGGHIEISTSGSSRDVQVSLVQDFLDLFVLPYRKRIAREQFETDVLRVANKALDTAAEVDKELVSAQAADRLVGLRKTVVEATEGAAALADAQLDAGNVSALGEASQRVLHEEAVVDLARDQLELVRHRERLNRLLGLSGAQTGWTFAETLPPPPADDAEVGDLEALAIARRLDVEVARRERVVIAHATELARDSRLFGRIEVGVDAHQFPNGPRVYGPNLVLELPIFDQRQALIARLEAQQRQADRHLTAVSVAARSEVRVARAEVQVARRIVDQYRLGVLPLRGRIVEESQLHYNGMLIGLYQLLQARQAEVEAQARYVAAVRDYWIARADLDRAVGGALNASEGRRP